MGANASSSALEPDGPEPKLSDVPESCIASVLSCLNPPEICELARLNRAFRAASSADFIWESKLPSNYLRIVKKLFRDELFTHLTKRDIYALLSRPNSFDGLHKEVWIDKRTAGVCLAISWKTMAITGIDDRRYWSHISSNESRFQSIAYLQQIWWLEVDGELEFPFPAGAYSLFFKLRLGRVPKRLGRRACSHESIHGWDKKPVQFQLATLDGQHVISRHMLDNLGSWENYHVGDFVVADLTSLTKLKFSMTQIDCTHSKGGLCLDSVLICPSSLGKQLQFSF